MKKILITLMGDNNMIYQGRIAGVALSTEYREGDRDWALYEKNHGRKDIEKVFQKMIELIEQDINLVRYRKTSLEWDEESYYKDCFEVGPDLTQDIWSEEERQTVRDFADYELDIIVNLKEGKVMDIILSGYGLP